MKLRNKNVLIVGMGESGKSALNFLIQKKAKVFVYDDSLLVRDQLKQTLNNCVVVDNIDGEFLSHINLLVLSPGVSIFSEVVKLACLVGVKVISELQLGLDSAKGNQILVTGTNGKTTTVNLLEQIFNYAKKDNLLVGMWAIQSRNLCQSLRPTIFAKLVVFNWKAVKFLPMLRVS